MKKTKLFLGALSLLAFAACSDDKNADAPDITPNDNKSYVKVSIVSATPGGSRSDALDKDQFQDGTDGIGSTVNENKIRTLLLVFYDANRNYIGDATVTENDIEMTSGNPTGEPDKNVEEYGTGVAEVSLGGVTPKYMMAFANPISSGDCKAAVDVVKKQIRTKYKNDADYFTMNNAVYFKSGTIQREVPVTEDHIFTSKEAATESTDSKKIITVYLERMAGKVTLSGNTGTETSLGKHEGTLDSKKLEFVVDGWGLNATAKQMYLSKFYDISGTQTYESINSTLSKYFYWNDSDRHRSYWAFSPDYGMPYNNTGVDFPYVSDQVTDASKFNYVSFKSILSEGSNHHDIGTTAYTLENTVRSSFYAKSNDYRNSALVSAVVVGHYKVDGAENTNFYVRNDKIYLEEDLKKEMAIIAGGYLVDATTGNALDNKSYTTGLFTIYHPETTADKLLEEGLTTADKKIQENRVTVELTSVSAASGLKYKADANTEAVSITDDNIKAVNQKLYETCGLSYAYTKGYAYFNIPVKHLGVTPSNEENPGAGSYGIVRNHHYQITVTGFEDLNYSTLGTGVFDPEEPIVPPTDPSDKVAVKAEMRVLSWRLVPQTVTLGKQ